MTIIKIIQHGNKRLITCPECDARMLYEKEDVVAVQTGMNEYQHSIICPDCGKEIVAQV